MRRLGRQLGRPGRQSVNGHVSQAVDLSVVVPAFNEQERIGGCIASMCDYLRPGARTWELIVVDDGSSDSTAAITEAMAAGEPRVRLVRSPRNRGKGHAVRLGVLASRGNEVLVSDADLSTPIDEIERLAARRNGAVAAIGSRCDPTKIELRQSRLRELLGRLGCRFIRTFAVSGIADTQCGFKLFDGPAGRALFAMARVNGWGFDIEILYLCARFGWPVVEVPVRWSHVAGSKLRPQAYLHVLGEIAQLRIVHRRARWPGAWHGRRIMPPRQEAPHVPERQLSQSERSHVPLRASHVPGVE